MYWYAGCEYGTGAIPCRRASAQVIRPLRLSSYLMSASIVAAATITDTGRGRRSDEHDGLERSALATSENPVERVRFTTIDGETVGATDSDDASCEPATIPGRDPLGGILAALLVAVHGRRSEREVAKVAGKAGLGPCNPRAQSPESWASLAATMCSMSVSAADAKQVPVYGP